MLSVPNVFLRPREAQRAADEAKAKFTHIDGRCNRLFGRHAFQGPTKGRETMQRPSYLTSTMWWDSFTDSSAWDGVGLCPLPERRHVALSLPVVHRPSPTGRIGIQLCVCCIYYTCHARVDWFMYKKPDTVVYHSLLGDGCTALGPVQAMMWSSCPTANSCRAQPNSMGVIV